MQKEKLRYRKSATQRVGLLLGPVLFFTFILFFNLDPENPLITRMAAVAVLMATWWITDAIPMYATALLPMLLYPLLGILRSNDTAPEYLNSTVFLYIGGFMIALTMEKWDLHKRIALFIIKLIGGAPNRIIFGFMVASAFLSMWISNTATALMMVPIGLAIILKMEDSFGIADTRKFTTCLMLGVAYGCSIGGVATLVGTPTNLAFVSLFQIAFPQAEPITFGTWFIMALPMNTIMIVVVWLMLTKVFFRIPTALAIDRTIVSKEYKELGAMSFEERTVLIFFSLTALLWVFRKDIVIGNFSIPGWSRFLSNPGLIDDATVALTMAMLMFLVPTRTRGAKSPTVMGTDVIRKLPWDIVLLFGGGFALAKGFQVSGLAEFLGNAFSGLAEMPPIVMVVSICFGITFITNLTTNLAIVQMIIPVLASVSIVMETNPLLLMIPATIAASYAFMLPVATPPNAIVFGSGRIKISDMARAGLYLNFIGIIIITVMFYLIGTAVFSIDPDVLPGWVQSFTSH